MQHAIIGERDTVVVRHVVLQCTTAFQLQIGKSLRAFHHMTDGHHLFSLVECYSLKYFCLQ
uniref:Uncharacterized protein n=1 Tax=Anguilla anguilla TaxID=7936 RepID=A0A0E9WYN2_ANGAN